MTDSEPLPRDMPPLPADGAPARPWGPWLTLAMGLGLFVIWILAQVLAGFGVLIIEDIATGAAGLTFDEEVLMGGDALAAGTLLGAICAIPCILFLMHLRRRYSLRDYLGLHSVGFRRMLGWLGLMFILMLVSDAITKFVLHRPVIPESMTSIYSATESLPLLWLALVLGAPLFEEVFFRSFLLEGFRHSRLGPVGAIVLTSALWSVIHMQYDWVHQAMIFILGLVLGYARVRTGSILVVIMMHGFNNLMATVQMHWWLH